MSLSKKSEPDSLLGSRSGLGRVMLESIARLSEVDGLQR